MFDKFDRAKVAIHNVKYSPLTKEPESVMNSPTNRMPIIITFTTTHNNGSFVITNHDCSNYKHQQSSEKIFAIDNVIEFSIPDIITKKQLAAESQAISQTSNT